METNTYNDLNEQQQLNKLVDIIAENPNSIFRIDNDSWSIYENYDGDDEDYEPEEYANDNQFNKLENCYGIALARAMMILLNRKGYNLEWEPV